MPRYYAERAGSLTPLLNESAVEAELRAAEFDAKGGGGSAYGSAYDATQPSTTASMPCLSSPGPADPTLFCLLTNAGSWVGYRWYKFVDQPSLQSLGLSAEERAYMQRRVEALHRKAGRTAR